VKRAEAMDARGAFATPRDAAAFVDRVVANAWLEHAGFDLDDLGGDEGRERRDDEPEPEVRSIHWSPYDPVGVVNADP
jgi:hypothetical protein